MSDPGVVTDMIGDGIAIPAIAAQMLVDFETLDLPSRARLAGMIWEAVFRHVVGAAEVAVDAGSV